MADLDLANKLLEDLRFASFEAGKKELDDTRKYAKEHGFEGELMNWDVNFWSERMKEDLFDISDEKLRPYFALPSVLDGLFGVCNDACCPIHFERDHPQDNFTLLRCKAARQDEVVLILVYFFQW
jgi:oligopeptidase A